MTTAITIGAKKVTTDIDSNLVTLTGIDIDELVSEFTVEELMDAILATERISQVVDYLTAREDETTQNEGHQA